MPDVSTADNPDTSAGNVPDEDHPVDDPGLDHSEPRLPLASAPDAENLVTRLMVAEPALHLVHASVVTDIGVMIVLTELVQENHQTGRVPQFQLVKHR